MPLQRRLPKRGFKSLAEGLTAEVRLGDLRYIDIADIDVLTLKRAGLISQLCTGAKVILSGSIDRAVKLSGVRVTKGARAAIEAAGGSVVDASPEA